MAHYFAWEIYHRQDDHRVRRKIAQAVIDQITFVCPGIGSLLAFVFAGPTLTLPVTTVMVIDALLLTWVAIEIFVYSDFRREPSSTGKAGVKVSGNGNEE